MARYKTKTGGKTAKKGDGVNPSIYSKSGGNLSQARPKKKRSKQTALWWK